MEWNQDYPPNGHDQQQSKQNAQSTQNAQNTQNTQDNFFFAPPPKKNAAYYRARAREALKGNYWWTVLAAFCYSNILGAALSIIMSITMIPMIFNMMQETGGTIAFDHVDMIRQMVLMYAVFGLLALVVLIFGNGPLTVGYYRLHLDPIDGKKVRFVKLFSGFSKKYWHSVGTYAFTLLPQLAVFLIYCVLCVPVLFVVTRLSMIFVNEPLLLLPIMLGIYLVLFAVVIVLEVVIAYRFSMALFIIAEYPEMRPVDAMRNSMVLMKGKCWKLFWLQFSFIGWYALMILATFVTCGLGAYVLPYMLTPYVTVAQIAFYDDIANRKAADETEFPSLDPSDYDPNEAKW